MATLKKAAAELLNQLDRKVTDNRVIVSCINTNSPLQEFVREDIHEGMLPDDYKYNKLYESLVAITEGYEDIYCLGLEPDIYTHELLSWASSNITRMEYLDQALTAAIDHGRHANFNQLIQQAQAIEIEDITYQVLRFVEAQAELEVEEEDDYEL